MNSRSCFTVCDAASISLDCNCCLCMLQAMSYPENSVGRPLPMEADPDAMNDKDEVCPSCHMPCCSVACSEPATGRQRKAVSPAVLERVTRARCTACCPMTTSSAPPSRNEQRVRGCTTFLHQYVAVATQ